MPTYSTTTVDGYEKNADLFNHNGCTTADRCEQIPACLTTAVDGVEEHTRQIDHNGADRCAEMPAYSTTTDDRCAEMPAYSTTTDDRCAEMPAYSTTVVNRCEGHAGQINHND